MVYGFDLIRGDNLAVASPDLLRAMVKTFADALMSAEADALCNAEYCQVSDERVNHRNGYRPREWDTPAGTVELAIPKLRSGSPTKCGAPRDEMRAGGLLRFRVSGHWFEPSA